MVVLRTQFCQFLFKCIGYLEMFGEGHQLASLCSHPRKKQPKKIDSNMQFRCTTRHSSNAGLLLPKCTKTSVFGATNPISWLHMCGFSKGYSSETKVSDRVFRNNRSHFTVIPKTWNDLPFNSLQLLFNLNRSECFRGCPKLNYTATHPCIGRFNALLL